ncbi:Uncharacterised protein [Mycobacterium tuberculosis]|nr:Uncharacterised protein [Mycobacterium tuberculosis]
MQRLATSLSLNGYFLFRFLNSRTEMGRDSLDILISHQFGVSAQVIYQIPGIQLGFIICHKRNPFQRERETA